MMIEALVSNLEDLIFLSIIAIFKILSQRTKLSLKMSIYKIP
jgi:hypothetical protein